MNSTAGRGWVKRSLLKLVSISSVLWLLTACSAIKPNLPAPETLALPEPVSDNTGRYLSPYTQDEVLAEWVDKVSQAKIGSFLGKTVCLLLSNASNPRVVRKGRRRRGPIVVHGLVRNQVASRVGDEIGRDLAIKAIGGWEYIREKSDLSFNSLDNMIVYLYIKYSRTDHYQGALDAASTIYPQLERRYYRAIRNARKITGEKNER
ncbi:MAG: hypothetical protein ACE5GM_09010 [bacterium]